MRRSHRSVLESCVRAAAWLVPVLLILACGGKSPSSGHAGYVVTGTLPAGSNFDEIVARLSPGGFVVVADPGTGEVATIVAPSSPAGTFANDEFSVENPAECPDCTDPTCGSTTRTIEITLRHDTGTNGATYSVETESTMNYEPAVTTPSSWTAQVGETVDFTTFGSLPSCAQFSHYFNVIHPDPCGGCDENEICDEGTCVCFESRSDEEVCSDAGAQCGATLNVCGHLVACGDCPGDFVCQDNVCVCEDPPEGQVCSDAGAECGVVVGPCGTPDNCGDCDSNEVCSSNVCVCEPDCAGQSCGDDGCGGSCGTCVSGQTCFGGSCCTPNCSGMECGSDGCGGSCGECSSTFTCSSGSCVCAQQCCINGSNHECPGTAQCACSGEFCVCLN
jgi:hypothetical protein